MPTVAGDSVVCTITSDDFVKSIPSGAVHSIAAAASASLFTSVVGADAFTVHPAGGCHAVTGFAAGRFSAAGLHGFVAFGFADSVPFEQATASNKIATRMLRR
jgi:hypothetical protein